MLSCLGWAVALQLQVLFLPLQSGAPWLRCQRLSPCLLKLDSRAQDYFLGVAWGVCRCSPEELPHGVPCFWEGGQGGQAGGSRGPGSHVQAACKVCRPTSSRWGGVVFSGGGGSGLCSRINAGGSLGPWREARH